VRAARPLLDRDGERAAGVEAERLIGHLAQSIAEREHVGDHGAAERHLEHERRVRRLAVTHAARDLTQPDAHHHDDLRNVAGAA
jgi:hypothetical protein